MEEEREGERERWREVEKRHRGGGRDGEKGEEGMEVEAVKG